MPGRHLTGAAACIVPLLPDWMVRAFGALFTDPPCGKPFPRTSANPSHRSAHASANGTGEGGWTDFLMTPVGGIGIRIPGDVARAKVWPALDRDLSGNIGARILNVAIKVMTDPSGMANAAVNMNFKGAPEPHPAGRLWWLLSEPSAPP
jgi:hypothetical protein